LSNMVAMLTNRVSQQQGMAAGNGGNSGENGGGADAAVGTNAMINAQQARVSGQLGALAEGVGTLIKEIRELKTMRSMENAAGTGNPGAAAGNGASGGGGGAGGIVGMGSLQGLLAAATVGKALNAIRNAQSALNIGAGNAMGQSLGAATSPAFTNGFKAGGAAGYGAIGLGALAGGLGGGGLNIGFGGLTGANGFGMGGAIPLPVQSPMVSFNGINAAEGTGSINRFGTGSLSAGLAGGHLADSLSTSLSALGPKAASHFLSNLAKGMNKVTSSYLAALKKQQKEQKPDNGNEKGGKGKKGKSKTSKRGMVVLPAKLGSLHNGGEKWKIKTQVSEIDKNDFLTVLLGEKRSKTKKSKGKKAKGKKKAEKRKISKQEKSDQNDALLAQKALGVSFGNGLKPRRPGVTLREYDDIRDIKEYGIDAVYDSRNFPRKSTKAEVLYNFDSKNSKHEDIALRIYGWFLPPLTGAYVFYTSCDDMCDLFVSPNENPMSKLKMVSQKDWSEHNEFDRYPMMQASAVMQLQAGRSYYIEAVQGNEEGNAHLSVGVQLPNGLMLRPISGEFLSREPLGDAGTQNALPQGGGPGALNSAGNAIGNGAAGGGSSGVGLGGGAGLATAGNQGAGAGIGAGLGASNTGGGVAGQYGGSGPINSLGGGGTGAPGAHGNAERLTSDQFNPASATLAGGQGTSGAASSGGLSGGSPLGTAEEVANMLHQLRLGGSLGVTTGAFGGSTGDGGLGAVLGAVMGGPSGGNGLEGGLGGALASAVINAIVNKGNGVSSNGASGNANAAANLGVSAATAGTLTTLIGNMAAVQHDAGTANLANALKNALAGNGGASVLADAINTASSTSSGKTWQNKVAQTVASGIAAGILSGGTAVINHIANTLKAKGLDISQAAAFGNQPSKPGGNGNGVSNGGVNAGVNGEGNIGNSDKVLNGNGGGSNNGNVGGNGGININDLPPGAVVYIGNNQKNRNNNNAGLGNGGNNNNGGQQGIKAVSAANKLLGLATGGSRGNDAAGKDGNAESLGTTYIFTGVNSNTQPTVSGTQRQVKKPDNNLLFSGSAASDTKGKDKGMLYKFKPLSTMGGGFESSSDGMHGILIPSHGAVTSMQNVHKEGRHMTPMEASENIGSVLNEVVGMIPHENYNFRIGMDDIHVKPPSVSGSIFTAQEGTSNLQRFNKEGLNIHGSKKKLVHQLAEAQNKRKVSNGNPKQMKSISQEKSGNGKQNVAHYENDSDEDDEDDDDFDIDKDSEDKEEVEDDKVPSDDEKKNEDIQTEKNEKDIANGKDLEEVFDELEDREDEKVATDQVKQNEKSPKQTGKSKPVKSAKFVSQAKPSIQVNQYSLPKKAITRRQEYLFNAGLNRRYNKMSQVKHSLDASRNLRLPVEIRNLWPRTFISKQNFSNVRSNKKSIETMSNNDIKETTKKRNVKSLHETKGNKEVKEIEHPKITLLSTATNSNAAKESHITRLYDEDIMKTDEQVKTREVAKEVRSNEREINYENDSNDGGNQAYSERVRDFTRMVGTKEIEKRNQIARSNISSNKSKGKEEGYGKRGVMKNREQLIKTQRGVTLANDLSKSVLRKEDRFKSTRKERAKSKTSIKGKSKTVSKGLNDSGKKISASSRMSAKAQQAKMQNKNLNTKLKRKQGIAFDGEKRSLFDGRNAKKEIANIAVKAFLPMLMNKIQHKIEANHGQRIYAFYPYDSGTMHSLTSTRKLQPNQKYLPSSLRLALLRSLFGGQASNNEQKQPQIINRLSYPVYFIPPMTQDIPPVLSIGSQPAFVPQLPVQRPPVASIGPEPPLLQQTPGVLPPVASIGPEPYFHPQKPTNAQKPVLSIAKDPEMVPTKSPSLAPVPAKPSPTRQKGGKDKKGRARHITPSMIKNARRFGPTQSAVDDYDTESSMHHNHYHYHYHHFGYGRPYEMDNEMHKYEPDSLRHGTQSSIQNTISMGQGMHEGYRFMKNDTNEHKYENGVGLVRNDANRLLKKNLSAILPGFVLVPGHQSESSIATSKHEKRSLTSELADQLSRTKGFQKRSIKDELQTKLKVPFTSKITARLRREGKRNVIGNKRSQVVDKITIANAAVKAFMPIILKRIVQRQMQNKPRKVLFLPIPVGKDDANKLAVQSMLPSVASIGPEPNVPPPAPSKMLPSVPSIGPEPNVPPPSPPKLLPSVPSIGSDPNVPPPSPPKLQTSKLSVGKDPAPVPTEKIKPSKAEGDKLKKEGKQKESGEKKKENNKQSFQGGKPEKNNESEKARKGKGRHITPKLYPFHLKDVMQSANYSSNFSKKSKSNGKGYVLVPHHEEEKTDRTEEYMEHYQDK